MKLNDIQIKKITKKISFSNHESIVRVNTTGKEIPWTENEINFNIYRVDKDYNIIWQIQEDKRPDFKEDPFVYLDIEKNGDIGADRFSGYEYIVDPETGKSEITGYHR